MDMVDWWYVRYGIARIHAYNPALRACSYAAKYLVKDNYRGGDWMLDVPGYPRTRGLRFRP